MNLMQPRQSSGNLCRALVLVSAILATFTPVFSRVAKAQNRRGPITTAEVEKSIDLAVDYLMQAQLADGGWPEFTMGHRYEMGVSCLVTLALLNAGVELDHPKLQKALDHISSRELAFVYTVSLQTMALCTANPRKYAPLIRRNAEWLIKAQNTKNAEWSGGWSYDQEQSQPPDESNSQFALLALHEAQRSGVANYPQATWDKVFQRSLSYWERVQLNSGAFGYRGNAKPRGSMTCAGIASLVIAGSAAKSKESSAGQTISCCGNDDSTNDRIERALNWLGNAFQVTSNPAMGNDYYYYYMYALERVGRLTGRRFIGRHDWYREGTEFLIRVKQTPNQGSFTVGRITDGNVVSDTAFALLFLSKGKRKILMSRLQYPSSDPTDWNNHSLAVQHITSHTEQAWKRDLAWQNMDINQASLAELLESPVLFISGTRQPKFSSRQKKMLKEYVEGGGFIFAEGCNRDGCNGQAFEQYFRELVVELFDKPLEALPPDHPIWYAEGKVQPEGLPDADANIYGVQSCCRLGVVYVPYSLSCRWELNVPYGAKPKYNDRVKLDLDTATLIGLNILSYATGKELKEKLDTVTILEDVDNQAPTERGVFFLPKLQHNAGYDDAVRAVPTMVQWMHKDERGGEMVSSERKIIPIDTENLQRYSVVYMHGRGELVLAQKQRDALKEFFENDGFLFADAVCADKVFAESFRREMEIILGDELTMLDPGHALFTDRYGGYPIRDVQIIDPTDTGETLAAATRRVRPRLEVGKKNGRMVLAFSELDLSCALESKHSLQCRGYFREDAARIGINTLLFALQQE